MKKLFLLPLILLTLCFTSAAQTKVYAEIVGDEYYNAGKVNVKIVFGNNAHRFAPMLLNENGKKQHFSTMVDAMNHLAMHGWRLENTYVIVDGDLDRVASEYHWIISKEEETLDPQADQSE